jgi:hypothetical protein
MLRRSNSSSNVSITPPVLDLLFTGPTAEAAGPSSAAPRQGSRAPSPPSPPPAASEPAASEEDPFWLNYQLSDISSDEDFKEFQEELDRGVFLLELLLLLLLLLVLLL